MTNRKGTKYKQYLSDHTRKVPYSTLRRWNQAQASNECEDAQQACSASGSGTQAELELELEAPASILDAVDLEDVDRHWNLHQMDEEEADNGGEHPPQIPSPAELLFGYKEEAERPIYPGASVNKGQLLALVLAYVLDTGTNAVGMQKLLDLLNVMAPGCVPLTNYFINKTFFHGAENAQVHLYCPNCEEYLGNGSVPNESCKGCGHHVTAQTCHSSNSFFLVMPLETQIKELLKNPAVQKSILEQQRQRTNCKSDVTSGKLYLNDFTRNADNLNLSLTFNTDGASIFKSSAYSIWPLLCTVNELPMKQRSNHVLLHSLWFGTKRPNVDTFLEPFISEVNQLYKDGIDWHDDNEQLHRTKVVASLCVCDAVARCMLQKFKQFNGEYGCGFCLHKGEVVRKGKGHVRVYPLEENQAPTRTHTGTIQHATTAAQNRGVTDEKGVKGASPLMLLPQFDIVKGFVPEYMHSVCLGVTKQFVSLWIEGAAGSRYRINKVQLAQIDGYLQQICPPSEVKRRPRSLHERHFWKASEWRAFLLLYSPVLLHGVLERKFYKHWLLLVYSVWTLLLPQADQSQLEKVYLCLAKFVQQIPELYGQEHVSYNVHTLLHLVESVQNWGLLWANSAFVFESTNGKLMNLFFGTQGVPLQIFKYYFASSRLQNHAFDLFDRATDEAKALFHYFLRTESRSVGAIPIKSGTAGLGIHVKRLLSDDEKQALARSGLGIGDATQPVRVFQRSVISSQLYTTKDYQCARNLKQNNSVVKLSSGAVAVITAFVLIDVDCDCFRECNCSKLVVFHKKLRKSGHQLSAIDNYAETNLLEHVVQVEESDCLDVCQQGQIACKCISIEKDGHKYVIAVPCFEVG